MTQSGAVPAEVTGLTSGQAYAAQMSQAFGSAASQAESFSADLGNSGVAGPAVAALGRAQELTLQASAAWAAAGAALDRQKVVRDAYATAPDAGGKEFVTDNSAGPPANPAPPATGGSRAAAKPLKDTLKLVGKINLAPGETLVGTTKVDGEDGAVRIASTDRNGSRTLRLGIGGDGFGSRDDEAGPWRAGPDQTQEINAPRKALREESNRIEDRLAEIDALDKIIEIAGGDPQVPLADLAAERDRIRARLDEITEHDMAVNRARARHFAGEQVDPAELDPPPYCAPGEYDRLRNRAHQLKDLPDPRVWDRPLRPAEPGEVDALEQRFGELEGEDQNEVYPRGYTATLDAAATEQLRTQIAAGLGAAEQTYQVNNAKFDEIDRCQQEQKTLRHLGRAWTPDEEAQWDRATARITELEEQTADLDYTVFAEGSVPGDWADVHYRVDLDDYDIGVELTLGAVPHGSGDDLSNLSEREEDATFDPATAKKLLGQLDRHLTADSPTAT